MLNLLRIALFTAVLVAINTRSAVASPVYKSIDASGKVQYSTKKPTPQSKPAVLPTIVRADVQMPKALLESCGSHGGISCAVGPDQDGSVICIDGYRDASARFNFRCQDAKLAIADLSETSASGEFVVVLRNSSAVQAKQVAVRYRPEASSPIGLNGPPLVEPYGTGEYHLDSQSSLLEMGLSVGKKPALGNFEISCSNCP